MRRKTCQKFAGNAKCRAEINKKSRINPAPAIKTMVNHFYPMAYRVYFPDSYHPVFDLTCEPLL